MNYVDLFFVIVSLQINIFDSLIQLWWFFVSVFFSTATEIIFNLSFVWYVNYEWSKKCYMIYNLYLCCGYNHQLVVFLSRIRIITKYNSNIQKAKISTDSAITIMVAPLSNFSLNSFSKSYIWNNQRLFQIIKNKFFCMNIFE